MALRVLAVEQSARRRLVDRQPRLVTWAIVALVFSLPFDGYAIYTPVAAIGPTNVALGLAVLAIVAAAAGRRIQLVPPPAFRPYLALVAWLIGAELISVLFSPSSRDTSMLRPVVTWIGFGLPIWLIGCQLEADRDLPRKIATAVVVSMASLAVLTAAVYGGLLPEPSTGNFGSLRVIGGTGLPFVRGLGSPIAFGYFGMLVALALPLLMQRMLGFRVLLMARAAAAGTILAILGTAIVTISRGVWVTSATVLLLSTGLVLAKRLRRRFVVLAGLATLAGFAFFSDPLSDLPATLNAIDPNTVSVRLESFTIAESLFSQDPLFGLGTVYVHDQIPAALAASGAPCQEACGIIHNRFIDVLTGTGLFGLLPFGWLWVLSLAGAWRLTRAREPLPAAEGIAYVVAVVGMVVQLQFFAGESLKVAAILMALIAAGATSLDAHARLLASPTPTRS